MDRKAFLKNSELAISGLVLAPKLLAGNAEKRAFFRLREINGHWWFISPEGNKFWSIGINHIDSATLRFAESGNLWEKKYGNSMKKWLKRLKLPVLTVRWQHGLTSSNCI